MWGDSSIAPAGQSTILSPKLDPSLTLNFITLSLNWFATQMSVPSKRIASGLLPAPKLRTSACIATGLSSVKYASIFIANAGALFMGGAKTMIESFVKGSPLAAAFRRKLIVDDCRQHGCDQLQAEEDTTPHKLVDFQRSPIICSHRFRVSDFLSSFTTSLKRLSGVGASRPVS
jgi:hypothetical protein